MFDDALMGNSTAHTGPGLSTYVWKLVLSIAVASVIVAYLSHKTSGTQLSPSTAKLSDLRGPPAHHWLLGNIRLNIGIGSGYKPQEWFAQYGHTFVSPMALRQPTLTTIDPTALSYILKHPDTFPKQASLRRQLARYMDPGLVVSEGPQHRRQRKMLSVSFSPPQIRRYHDSLAEVTAKLQTKLGEIVSEEAWKEVEMLEWCFRWSEDAIGAAGFGEDLGQLDFRDTKLSKALEESVRGIGVIGPMWLFQSMVPLIDYIPNPITYRINQNRMQTRELCRTIFDRQKRAMGSELGSEQEDVLSVMLKAHLDEDVAPEDRLTDDEVIAQISGLLLAAKSNAGLVTVWGLYELARHPEHQDTLRKEISQFDSKIPSFDELVNLPYLNAVIREVLRFRPPLPQTLRTTTEDTIIPFASPIIDKCGTEVTSLYLKKGTSLIIPIVYANKSPDIWGPTADQFDPSRFLREDFVEPVSAGVWGHMMSFIGGPRGCIGFQFALAELRLFFFLVIRHFEFRTVPEKQVERWPSVKDQPVVLGEEEKGHQLPLLVRKL